MKKYNLSVQFLLTSAGQGQTGALPNGGQNATNAAMQNTEDTQGQDKPESVTEPPDNDLIDFDAF